MRESVERQRARVVATSRRLAAGVSILALLATSVSPAWSAPAKPPKEADIAAYLADKPPALHPFFRSVMLEGERNRVLNLNRAGLAALQLGDDATAALAFDQALERIEAIYADNEKAKKARSLWVKESTKDFKGEPYERAMAFYYRGVVYLRQGDYENARASFQQGQLQDAFAEAETYKSDYASLEVLSGWASQCLGDQGRADEFYQRAREIRPDIAIPKPEDRVLLLADVGVGPQKWADGQYMENLRFRGVAYDEAGVTFLGSDAEHALLGRAQAAVDAFTQATQADEQAAKALKDHEALAANQRALAQATAQTLEAALLTPPEATPAEPLADPASPAPAKRPAPATAKAAAAAAAAAARERDVELLALERVALNAALAADKSGADLAGVREASLKAQAEAQVSGQRRNEALASLQPYGLQLTEAARAHVEAPTVAPTVATSGENLLWQASTRGGRMIDAVLAGKAQFKENATEFGNTMTQASLIAVQTANQMTMQAQSLQAQGYNVNNSGGEAAAYAGMAFLAVGLISNMAAKAARPQADIRYWDTLPGEIRYATRPGEAGAYRIVLQDAGGRFQRSAMFEAKGTPGGRCAVGWTRTRTAVDVAPSAPNSELTKR